MLTQFCKRPYLYVIIFAIVVLSGYYASITQAETPPSGKTPNVSTERIFDAERSSSTTKAVRYINAAKTVADWRSCSSSTCTKLIKQKDKKGDYYKLRTSNKRVRIISASLQYSIYEIIKKTHKPRLVTEMPFSWDGRKVVRSTMHATLNGVKYEAGLDFIKVEAYDPKLPLANYVPPDTTDPTKGYPEWPSDEPPAKTNPPSPDYQWPPVKGGICDYVVDEDSPYCYDWK